jgi:4-alpha-glucanotransferase
MPNQLSLAKSRAKADFQAEPDTTDIVEKVKDEWRQRLSANQKKRKREAFVAFVHKHDDELDDHAIYDLICWEGWQSVERFA